MTSGRSIPGVLDLAALAALTGRDVNIARHPGQFNWQSPDYREITANRIERLRRLRADPRSLAAVKIHYRSNPGAFIADWGCVAEPRHAERGLPTTIPFLLFPKQQELVEWIVERWRNQEPGLIEKSRDSGVSWLTVALACTLSIFNRGIVVGFGSRKVEYVDQIGNLKSIFEKARFFLSHLPQEFLDGWSLKDAPYMRIKFPGTGSALTGEGGDSIGRGDRTSLYIIDESAHLERPELIDASLSATTNCRIDVSTPHGRSNSFAVKRHNGRIPVFTFGWRSDPRKSALWYARQCELLDPVTRAQEIDLSYDASVEGILIPSEWVQAAVGAHIRLGLEPTGARRGALDVADEGRDRCAFIGRRGILLDCAHSWSGKGSDIYRTVVKTFGICDQHGYGAFDFDGDGLGAGVRGDAVDINSKRREAGKREIDVEPFRGSGAVFDPDGSLVEGRFNKDFFANLKAQAWWSLRLRFQQTFRAVVERMPYDADSVISISADLPELTALVTELTQPTYSLNAAGKIIVDKSPDGALSPNLADAVMIAFSQLRAGAYFAPPIAHIVARSKVDATPSRMDFTFAVVSFVEDTAAVVFCAANRRDGDGARGPGFFVLDWDLRQLDANAEGWMWGIAARLDELHVTASGKMQQEMRIYCDDFDEGFSELMRQRGFPVLPIGKDLPPIAERFNRARPYVTTGMVAIARLAQERQVTFHGATRNFLRELSTQAQVTPTNPLAIAFATAILTVFRGRDAISLPKLLHDAVIAATPPPMTTAFSARHAAHAAAYAAWQAKADAARDRIRAKTENPHWRGTWHQLGIGPPPPSPGIPIG